MIIARVLRAQDELMASLPIARHSTAAVQQISARDGNVLRIDDMGREIDNSHLTLMFHVLYYVGK
jgi:hypothetical protein